MPLPPDPIGTDWISRRFNDVERMITELGSAQSAQATTIGAGGLVVKDGGELSVLHDTTNQWIWHSGKGSQDKYFVTMRRDDGSVVFEVTTLPSGDQIGTLRDRANRVLYADDGATGIGMARPWLPVPMCPKFAMPAGTYSYMNIAAPGSETQIWEGRIPLVSHPYVAINGIWGQASGTNSTTYRLKTGAVTLGSWTVGGALFNDTRGLFDIRPFIDQEWLPIELTAQSTGSGQVGAQVYGCAQRQS